MNSVIHLVRPHVRYHETFLAAHFEFRDEFRNADGAWGAPACESGYPGISFTRAEMNTLEGFERFVHWRLADVHEDAPRPAVQVPTTHLWIIDDETQDFLGSVHIRHRLTDFLQDMGGHISYSVRPSARRRGVASAALREGLRYAAEHLGLERVLITTTEQNRASARVIEHNGGVLQDVNRGMLRYWVATTPDGVALPPEPAAAVAEPVVVTPADPDRDPDREADPDAGSPAAPATAPSTAPRGAGAPGEPGTGAVPSAGPARAGLPSPMAAAPVGPLMQALLSRIGVPWSRTG